MFSGIVEQTATVVALEPLGGNVELTLEAPLAPELKVDQSLAHNGVCLTVTGVDAAARRYRVTAVDETLRRSNLGSLKVGHRVNLERAMAMGGRLDGHIVQGHVDTTGTLAEASDEDGSRRLRFSYAVSPELEAQGYVTVEKGSVAVNGVSLTVCDSAPGSFSVAVIPYTLENTNLGDLRPGDSVNLEFDILGKYIARLLPR